MANRPNLSLSLASKITISLVNIYCKTVLYTCATKVKVHGLEDFLSVLESSSRQADKRGILTYSNHNAVGEDPVMWGVLPWSITFRGNHRWTLGASDVLFNIHPMISKFFLLGQTISTIRGGGIFQSAITNASQKLNEGKWVHVFPEGYVDETPPSFGRARQLRRFKWGISQIIDKSYPKIPVIVPIWVQGIEKIYPESRKFPRFLPRLGQEVRIFFGQPVEHSVSELVGKLRTLSAPQSETESDNSVASENSDSTTDSSLLEHSRTIEYSKHAPESWTIRAAIAAKLQSSLQLLGHELTSSHPPLPSRDK